jgi:hypothetical protein
MFSASNLLAAARFFLQDICRDSGESLQLRQACLFAADRDKKSDISNGTATDDADDDDETMLELDRWYLIGNGNGTVAPHTLNPVLHMLLACLLLVKKPCIKPTPTTSNSGVMSSCRYRSFVVLGSRTDIAVSYRWTPEAVHFRRFFLERYVCDNCLSPSFFRSVLRDR